MAEPTDRYAWVLKLNQFVLVVALVVITICLAAAAAAMVLAQINDPGLRSVLRHLYPIAICIVAAVLAMLLHGVVAAYMRGQQSVAGLEGRMLHVETLLEDIAAANRKQADLASLSDQSKSLLFRDREIEAFRDTIRDDIIRQDYKSAAAMVDAAESRFGYADEAKRLRAEIDAAQKSTLQEKGDAAIARIREIVQRHDWTRALREAQRVIEIFPDNSKVQSLPKEIETARTRHKRDLLTGYGDAVKKNEVDRGIALLRELDVYLTPKEAAALEESARGVFRAKLHNLGVQFEVRVTDGQWAEALAVGEEIIRDYPNTRMAQQVRDRIDSLRSRAGAKT